MTDVDRQIQRSTELLDRTRHATDALGARARRRREADVIRRIGRIAIADTAIIVAALVIGFFVPIGMFGALLVMGLLIAATVALAVLPVAQTVATDQLGRVPLRAVPGQTNRWLESQRPALPAPARTLVDSIGVKLDILGQQIADLDENEPAAAEVRKLVSEQLPGLVQSYSRVPEPLRRVERNGRTPDAQLIDALGVIDGEIGEMSAKLAQGDIDHLATRERFLQIKYQGDGTAT